MNFANDKCWVKQYWPFWRFFLGFWVFSSEILSISQYRQNLVVSHFLKSNNQCDENSACLLLPGDENQVIIKKSYISLKKNLNKKRGKIQFSNADFFFDASWRNVWWCCVRLKGTLLHSKSTAINGAKAGQLLRHSSCITAKGKKFLYLRRKLAFSIGCELQNK